MYLEVREKTEEVRSKIRVGEINRTENGEMEKGKAKKIKGLYLGKCGKTEKALTGNEALQPIEIKHVALRWATAATTQSMWSRTPSAITEKKNKKIIIITIFSYSYNRPRNGRPWNRGVADTPDQNGNRPYNAGH